MARSPVPYVSVIVPAYAAMESLPDCVQCLVRQTYPKERFEIIIVDNGENIGLQELSKEFPGLVVISESRQGSYVSRNSGVKKAKGEIIAFTDADCLPESQFIEEGVKAMESCPDCGLIGGRVALEFGDPENPTSVELYEHATTFLQETYISRNHATTSNVFTRRDVLENVGGFNEELKSRGDMEWSSRVARAGYRLSYSDAACVVHPTRKTFDALAKRSRRMVGGRYDLAQISRFPWLIFSTDLLRAVLPLQRLIAIAKYREVDFPQKLKFLSLLGRLCIIEIKERVRLQFSAAESQRC